MATIFDPLGLPNCGIPFKCGLIKGAELDVLPVNLRWIFDGAIYVEGLSVGW